MKDLQSLAKESDALPPGVLLEPPGEACDELAIVLRDLVERLPRVEAELERLRAERDLERELAAFPDDFFAGFPGQPEADLPYDSETRKPDV
ncbi:MAG: hypothetical protein WBG19_05490 [Thermoplasmata archaeon]